MPELRVRFAPSPTGYLHVGGKVVSFDVASGAVHWTWKPDSGFAFLLGATAGNGVVAMAFLNDGTHHIARLDSSGQATLDDWTWPGFLIQYAFGDMWLAQGSVEAISAPAILWPFSVWPEVGKQAPRASKRKIKLEVFEVESAAPVATAHGLPATQPLIAEFPEER